MRVGVYADLRYQQGSDVVSATLPFVTWLSALGEHVDELVIYGRVDPRPGRSSHPVSGSHVRFVPLPWYESLRRPGRVLAAARGSLRTWAAEAGPLDAVLLFGPHPLSLLFGISARRRRIPVVVGVRQDFPRYVRCRTAGAAYPLAVLAAELLERAHRHMAGWGGAIVVDEKLARRYRRRAPVLVTGISLVRAGDLPECVPARSWPGSRSALSVGRLDPEKNPLLLADVLAFLRATGPWSLTVAGDGSMKAALVARARTRGLEDALTCLGMVDSDELWHLYRSSTVFVHVSWTEGVPQVLFEAAAAGIPIVATAVGGVAAALDDGRRGLLVPPGDARAVADAVHRLGEEPDLRRSLVAAAFDWVADETLDRQAARAAAYLGGVVQRFRMEERQ